MRSDEVSPRVLDADFALLERLGRGGVATVIKARQKSLGREVALKLLPAELSARQRARFGREAARLAALDHPNIVAVYDFGVIGTNRPCIVMQLVRGRDLGEILAAEGRLGLARAIDLIGQAADGLAHAHGRGIIHRDVKPANLLVTTEVGREHVLVADFGVAHDERRGATSLVGLVSGTPAWMSPEQCAGEHLRRFHRMKHLRAPWARRAAASALLTFTLAATPACADEDPGCTFPTGTYTVEASYVSGDCDFALRSSILSAFPHDVSVYNDTCGLDTDEGTSVDAQGCVVTLELFALRGDDGVTQAQLDVTRDCRATSCTATFNLYYTHR